MTEDLFERYDQIPPDVAAVLERHSILETTINPYVAHEAALEDLAKLGYTYEYDLGGEAYDLRRMNEDERICFAREKGLEAFWNTVLIYFPDVKTGDVDFGEEIGFAQRAYRIIRHWFETNKRMDHDNNPLS